METYSEEHQYGRSVITGMALHLSARRQRNLTHGRKAYFHRTRNGVNDPMTYYHVLDALMQVSTNEVFRTADFMPFLSETHELLVWDATTVGRVINDIADQYREVNGREAIQVLRRWNGKSYRMSSVLEDRVGLLHLLEDLSAVCEALIEAERTGQKAPRAESPLMDCPSLATVA
jgi:hypothetical protein